MALAPVVMYRAQPGATTTTLYTVTNTAGKYAIIKQIVLCNIDTVARTISMATVATGGSESDANRFLKDAVIPPKSTVVFDFSIVLVQNESLRATASAASVITATVSGVAN